MNDIAQCITGMSFSFSHRKTFLLWRAHKVAHMDEILNPKLNHKNVWKSFFFFLPASLPLFFFFFGFIIIYTNIKKQRVIFFTICFDDYGLEWTRSMAYVPCTCPCSTNRYTFHEPMCATCVHCSLFTHCSSLTPKSFNGAYIGQSMAASLRMYFLFWQYLYLDDCVCVCVCSRRKMHKTHGAQAQASERAEKRKRRKMTASFIMS